MPNSNAIEPQKYRANNSTALATPNRDDLSDWMAMYFEHEVTTSEKSQKEQLRDLNTFLAFLERDYGDLARIKWTPRVSKDFQATLQREIKENGSRRWSDRTINRMMAHLKTFAGWIHKHAPFPLGHPTEKIKQLSVSNQLEIERAITPQERNHLLDAADQLLIVGGRSKDRTRYANAGKRPPVRKDYRPYRNRAIVYTLVETGMRRAAIVNLNLADIDAKNRILSVMEKGGSVQPYPISKEGLAAILDYLENEREGDDQKFNSPALFLKPATVKADDGRLTAQVVNKIWNETRKKAGVSEDKTPHSARHGMGAFVMKQTGNIAAVQRQLGHKNAAFSMQYSRVTNKELQELLDERK